jgi:hypothetical protein
MHERIRQRLEAVEAARRLRDCASTQIIHIQFPGLEPEFAEGPEGFRCDRRPHEPLEDFENRCCEELLAHIERPKIPPILLYGCNRENPTKPVALSRASANSAELSSHSVSIRRQSGAASLGPQ